MDRTKANLLVWRFLVVTVAAGLVAGTLAIRLRQSRYWRARHAGALADLPGADLTGATFAGAILAGANLAGAHMARADLQGANLVGADLRDANLTRANLPAVVHPWRGRPGPTTALASGLATGWDMTRRNPTLGASSCTHSSPLASCR